MRLLTGHRVLGALVLRRQEPLNSDERVFFYIVADMLATPLRAAEYARRLESEIARAVDDPSADSFRTAQDLVREARQLGLPLASPRAAEIMSRTVLTAVERVLEEPTDDRVRSALGLLRLTRDLGLGINVERAQELVFDAIVAGRAGAGLRRVGDALGIAIGR